MKIRYIALLSVTVLTALTTLFSSCKKINQYTELGSGLIPPVDNITTFDTLIDVQAFNDTFSLATDSQYLNSSQIHFLGRINSDPFFGKTDAQLFLQLKPSSIGVYPFARKDSLIIDSVVLVLGFVDAYGDTTAPQSLNVYEVTSTDTFSVTSYLVRNPGLTYGSTSLNHTANQQVIPKNLYDSVKAFRDTTLKQLRIKLDSNFGRRMMNYDTTNAYKNDSLFNKNFNGFAIRSENIGNAIMGFDLTGLNTKLAFYYRYPKGTGTGDTSTVTYFGFIPQFTATANLIKRDYAGTEVATAAGGTAPDPFVYVQGNPGTFANLKIPGLNSLSNRVVHRAELIMEQVYDASNTTFTVPDALYVDAFDPSITSSEKYRSIPYDLVFDRPDVFAAPQNLNNLGLNATSTVNGSGQTVAIWKFNLTRYLQHVVNKVIPSPFDLRVYAPFTVRNTFFSELSTTKPAPGDAFVSFALNPTIATGRVKLVGNNSPGDTNPRRMRLRIVYSKL